MTRASLISKARDFAWLIGVLGGILGATGAQWVTGGTRITGLESRVKALEKDHATVIEALALDLCLRTTEPRIRAPLRCGEREAGR